MFSYTNSKSLIRKLHLKFFCTTMTSIYIPLQKRVEYFSDWENGVSGVIKGAYKDAKNDFAITLTAFVEAGSSTGYLASIEREHDGKVW